MTADTAYPSATTPPPAGAEHASRALGVLLKIADNYRAQNQIRQAIEMYFDLLAKYGHVPEVSRVRDRLLSIAEEYETKGDFRQARSLCERLL
jgi:hypothetical protein